MVDDSMCRPGTRDQGLIHIYVTGSGFLQHMVRIIVGTLLEIGKGRKKPEDMPAILEAKDRSKAGPTAVAKGLILWNVEYEAADENNLKSACDLPGDTVE